MKLLLVPDPTSPHSEDAFCRELASRAASRGHETRVHTVPNGPLEATLDQLSATGFGLACDAVFVNSLQPAAILAADRCLGSMLIAMLAPAHPRNRGLSQPST
mgnify:CR=1 FL=1